mmetsp:Transcript_15150/g.17161  ORF Transcript_15150/g.17161 Transcript_15150/m.17161 type:complete len:455 (+) Transcript_15150:299-1663(+)|eukprot:CAMPEP_0184021058 /NCGR_PEP_ID=MMETSP0954-20121128/9700_1 /TAXON_ID=627963 /ORGANISM="Aplanochytrium sp, Strain PBS07" /LENGTH=454 /DNA_ID=CAMNT_0026303001 /DNA_START=200 /DNA_END=1564 /DNA_ORIENTATION=+
MYTIKPRLPSCSTQQVYSSVKRALSSKTGVDFATRCAAVPHHTGEGDCEQSLANEGLALPIMFGSTYRLKNADHGARLHSKEETVYADSDGWVYTRWGNPTNEAAARAVAALEGAKESLLFSSGMNSITGALLSVLKAGDHAIFPHCVYGGTSELVHNYLSNFGIESTFVDSTNIEEYENALRPNTRVLYAESPANPTMRLTDLKRLAELSANQNVTDRKTYTIVDNTFSTSYHIRTLDLGVDVSVQSATKYLGGHSDVLAGVISSNDERYMVEASKYQKIFGSLLDPMQSFLLARGIRTLDVRMERHAKNAQKIAEFLEGHPAVDQVFYPGLKSHPDYELGLEQFRPGKGFGGMLSFLVKGGLNNAKFVVENLKVVNLAVSLGSVESLIEHPSSMTHTMIPKEQREAGGLPDSLVRLSVGIEDSNDLIMDLDQALNASRSVQSEDEALIAGAH